MARSTVQTAAAPSHAAVTTRPPSGLKSAIWRFKRCARAEATCSHVSVSQSATHPLFQAVIRSEPSDVKLAAWRRSAWVLLLMVFSSVPVAASHSVNEPSSCVVTTRRPSGVKVAY